MSYVAGARCRNCWWEGELTVAAGKPVRNVSCPQCGQKRLNDQRPRKGRGKIITGSAIRAAGELLQTILARMIVRLEASHG